MHVTVGDLIDYLQQLDPSTPIVLTDDRPGAL